MQGLDQGSRPFCTNSLPFIGWLSTNPFLNGIQSCESFQSLARDGRGMRLLQVVELAPDVRPASDFLNVPILFLEWLNPA